jgi:hypothetical protein
VNVSSGVWFAQWTGDRAGAAGADDTGGAGRHAGAPQILFQGAVCGWCCGRCRTGRLNLVIDPSVAAL